VQQRRLPYNGVKHSKPHTAYTVGDWDGSHTTDKTMITCPNIRQVVVIDYDINPV
jgi:hypothetical protein